MNSTLEQIKNSIITLPPPEREKLREWLDRESERETEGKSKFGERDEKFRRSMAWIQKNREQFDGQWVALDGDTLLAHGADGKKVHAEAQAKGVKTPLMHRVSVKENQPFGGW